MAPDAHALKNRLFDYFTETRHLTRLALPILAAQLAQTAMSLVDTLMAGQVGATDLAAISVATSFWLPIMLFVQGITMALTPVVAQLNGAQKQAQIPAAVIQALWLVLLTLLPAMLLLYYSPLVLDWMGVEPALAAKTRGYLHAILWGLPAYGLYQVLRNYTEGLSHTLPSMGISFIGLLINIPANYLFIYGKWGFPALGGVGCGVASAIVFTAMGLTMLAHVQLSPLYRTSRPFIRPCLPAWPQIARLFHLGFPIALAIFCEVTLFAVIAVLLAPLGAPLVASHQVALNFSTLIFMLPLSLGFAVTIRVGHSMGEGLPLQARRVSLTGLGIGLSLTLLSALLTLLGRDWIADRYSDDPVVIQLAAHLLIFAALYQFSDSIQAVSAGALRGYKDTRVIFLITLLAYWGLGLPSGIILGLTDWLHPAMGPQGFWIGIIIGLSSAAALLGLRLRTAMRRAQAGS